MLGIKATPRKLWKVVPNKQMLLDSKLFVLIKKEQLILLLSKPGILSVLYHTL